MELGLSEDSNEPFSGVRFVRSQQQTIRPPMSDMLMSYLYRQWLFKRVPQWIKYELVFTHFSSQYDQRMLVSLYMCVVSFLLSGFYRFWVFFPFTTVLLMLCYYIEIDRLFFKFWIRYFRNKKLIEWTINCMQPYSDQSIIFSGTTIGCWKYSWNKR